MPSLFSCALVAMVGSVSAAGKCANMTAPPYSLVNLTSKSACLAGSGDTQWFGAFKQDNPAGGTPRKKTWWTKSKSGDKVHFGGKITGREAKLLHEQGFSAIYALSSGNADEEAAAKEAGLLLKEGAGCSSGTCLEPDTDASIAAVESFLAFVEANTGGHVYLHCGCGLWSGAAVQLHKAKTKATTDSAVALAEMEDHGYGMSAAFVTKLKTFTATDGTATELKAPGSKMCGSGSFWKAKYLGKFGSTELYDAGQIYSGEVATIAGGFAAVVNMRKSSASQETTTLLNAMDNKKAYVDGKVAGYLSTGCSDNLTETSCFKIDDSRPTTWISNTATVNVELINTFEFGDNGGYNEAIESSAFATAKVDYTHLPIGSNYTIDAFLAYGDQMIDAINTATATSSKKAVLYHCRTGYRTGAFPSMLVGALMGTSKSAILARLANLGYSDTSGNMGKLIEAVSGKVTFTGTINATSGHITYTSPALIKTPALAGDPTKNATNATKATSEEPVLAKNSASFMATAVLVPLAAAAAATVLA